MCEENRKINIEKNKSTFKAASFGTSGNPFELMTRKRSIPRRVLTVQLHQNWFPSCWGILYSSILPTLQENKWIRRIWECSRLTGESSIESGTLLKKKIRRKKERERFFHFNGALFIRSLFLSQILYGIGSALFYSSIVWLQLFVQV